MFQSSKINISHITKFDGNYFHVWMCEMTLNFKQEKIMAIEDGTELKPIAPTATYIIAKAQALLTTRPSNIVKWEEQDTLVVIFINNCLNIVSSCMFNLKITSKQR